MSEIDVLIVGDGPGGLAAALFLAKAGKRVTVYGQDKTAMHAALLKNYLGIAEMTGSDFQQIARQQVESFGARLVDARVESVVREDGGFRATLDGGESVQARYLILSEGKSPKLAKELGLAHDPDHGVSTDRNGKTEIEGVYAVGRLVRPGRSQAQISAGDGASAAIDILSIEKGSPYLDWDSPA